VIDLFWWFLVACWVVLLCGLFGGDD